MRIAVFGLGYVGCVSLGCLAEEGHDVIGVDVSDFKVGLINSGKPTIVEKDIDKLISANLEAGRISATTNHTHAVMESDVAIVCVGTPSLPSGELNLGYVRQVVSQIGEALRHKDSFYTIVLRSTVSPGTNLMTGNMVDDISGKRRNINFAVVSNPEFLREGSAVYDYRNPALTVIGTESDRAFEVMASIYVGLPAPMVRAEIGAAEMIKYVNNSFHALKIAFANEVGVIARSLGVDSVRLMDLFARDDKLNISRAYLRPGYSYGGSCLPKDLAGLCSIAYDNRIEVPVLASVERSNTLHNARAFDMIEAIGEKEVGIIGLAFKNGTDDLRNSPAVELAERLLGKGYKISIFDRNVVLSKLLGANKSYIEEKLPHISAMMADSPMEVIGKSRTVVLVHRVEEIITLAGELADRNIVDLAGYPELSHLDNYRGIAW